MGLCEELKNPNCLLNFQAIAKTSHAQLDRKHETMSSNFTSFRLLSFNFNGTATLQSSGGFALAPELSWYPHYFLSRNFSIGAMLGGSLFPAGTNTFIAINTQLLFEYLFSNMGASVGGGAQTWLNYGGVGPCLSLQLNYNWHNSWLSKIFVMYSLVLFTNLSQQFRAGVGLSF